MLYIDYVLMKQGLKLTFPREFPGGPVVRTLYFHCRGAGDRFLVRELRFCKLSGAAKKKKERKKVNIRLDFRCLQLLCLV